MDNRDNEHLQLLSIFHYVAGGLLALASLFPVLHVMMGLIMILAPTSSGAQADEQAIATIFGLMFILVPLMIIATGWIIAGLIIFTGRCLQKRTRHMFCLVVAGLECIFVPIGTVLGVFTIIILIRDSVKQQFGVPTQSASFPPPTQGEPPPTP